MNRVEQLRSIPLKAFTQDDFNLLEEEGIINWVGGANLPEWVRMMLTQLFFYLDWRMHDARYWQIQNMPYKEREEERRKADFWLLKYSFLSPIKVIEDFKKSWYILKDIYNFIETGFLFLILMPLAIFTPLIYISVRVWWVNVFKN